MNKLRYRVARVIVSLLAVALTWALVYVFLPGVPMKTHGSIIGSLAIIFGVIDTIVWNGVKIIDDLGDAKGFNATQYSRLAQAITQGRSLLLNLYCFNLFYRLIGIGCGAVLFLDALRPHHQDYAVAAGYAVFGAALAGLVTMLRVYRRASAFRQQVKGIQRDEAARREITDRMRKSAGMVV